LIQLPHESKNFKKPAYPMNGQSDISSVSTYFKDLKIAKKLSSDIFNLLKDNILMFYAILPIFAKNASFNQK
jgi:hypothetical protein